MKYYVNKNIYHNGKGIKGGEIFDPVDVGYDENDIKYLLNQFKIRPFDEVIKKNEVVETVKREEVKIVEVDIVADVQVLIPEGKTKIYKTPVNELPAEEAKLMVPEARNIGSEKLDIKLDKPKIPKINYVPEQTDLPLADEQARKQDATREKLRKMLRDGKLDDRIVELEVSEPRSGPMIEIFSAAGMEDMGLNLKDMLGNIMPQKKKRRNVKVPEALEIMAAEEA